VRAESGSLRGRNGKRRRLRPAWQRDAPTGSKANKVSEKNDPKPFRCDGRDCELHASMAGISGEVRGADGCDSDGNDTSKPGGKPVFGACERDAGAADDSVHEFYENDHDFVPGTHNAERRRSDHDAGDDGFFGGGVGWAERGEWRFDVHLRDCGPGYRLRQFTDYGEHDDADKRGADSEQCMHWRRYPVFIDKHEFGNDESVARG